jgi:large subunit ribosomal protein L9
MKVILKDYVEHVGKMGEVVNVSDGYGRNFLLPKGLAVRASTENVARLEHELAQVLRQQASRLGEAESLAKRVNAFTCTIEKAVGEGGKLYGSVTSMDIMDKLHGAGLTAVERRQVQLEKPIKELGEYTVSVRIHPEVSASIQVTVSGREED